MRIIFTGRVQGVGFRARARAIANELDLTIDAKNLADGSVEIIAHGDPEKIHSLVYRLKQEYNADAKDQKTDL